MSPDRLRSSRKSDDSVCPDAPRSLVLPPLRGRSRDKPRSYHLAHAITAYPITTTPVASLRSSLAVLRSNAHVNATAEQSRPMASPHHTPTAP